MTDTEKLWATAGLTLAISAAAHLLVAQAGSCPEPEPRADSPIWWTLSDSVLPLELRASLLDPEQHRQHYLEAVERGLARPLPPEELSRLKYFIDGRLTPERFRACESFDSFVVGWLRSDELVEQARASLLDRYGLNEEGVEVIIRTAGDVRRQRASCIEEIAPQQDAFIELLRRAKSALSAEEYQRAYESRDLTSIAAATGRDLASVEELAEAWERDVALEVSAAGLETLLRLLSASDWESFRRYLLHEVAAHSSTIEFEEER